MVKKERIIGIRQGSRPLCGVGRRGHEFNV